MDEPITQPGPAAAAAVARVLLIEDNQGFAYFVRDLLTRKNPGRYTIEHAATLADGLAKLEKGATDIILLDLGLPDSARMDTFTRVRDRYSDIPVIILTVLDDDEVARHAVRAGAQDYLVKDRVDGPLLVRAIAYAIERARSEHALHELSARILQLQDEERRRVARELHDATAQNLAALSMNLALLSRQQDHLSREAVAALRDSMACADQCARELRTMSYLLHPPLLDEVGLVSAVREYTDGFAARSGIRVTLDLPPSLDRLPTEAETTLFRVMQESLANIHRHSGSASAAIRLTLEDGGVRLEVRDAGHGIPPGKMGEDGVSGMGVGIRGMIERVHQLGGQLRVDTGPTGTTVTATLPLGKASP
jgi:signal transduction histidine kinase